MMGTSKQPGIAPKAIKQVFQAIDSRPDTLFVVQVSFLLENFFFDF
jgi:hypothetical protein